MTATAPATSHRLTPANTSTLVWPGTALSLRHPPTPYPTPSPCQSSLFPKSTGGGRGRRRERGGSFFDARVLSLPTHPPFTHPPTPLIVQQTNGRSGRDIRPRCEMREKLLVAVSDEVQQNPLATVHHIVTRHLYPADELSFQSIPAIYYAPPLMIRVATSD